MPKPLKVPSLARSVPKPLLIELSEAGGHQPGRYVVSEVKVKVMLFWSFINQGSSSRF